MGTKCRHGSFIQEAHVECLSGTAQPWSPEGEQGSDYAQEELGVFWTAADCCKPRWPGWGCTRPLSAAQR